MIEFTNKKGNTIKIFGDIVEQEAVAQISALAEFEPYLDSKIRIMPDVHAGTGCTVGTTMTVGDRLTPNLVGVDIGCGMYVIQLGKTELDLERLDVVINSRIPSGMNIHETAVVRMPEIRNLKCFRALDAEKVDASIGTLGGGNHFIEANVDDEGNKYIVIHSGSRNLGVRVCNFYQKLAVEQMVDAKGEIQKIIDRLKSEGRQREINDTIRAFERKEVDKALAYVEGDALADYLHDMAITQRYAKLNRETMAHIIAEGLGLDINWAYAFHTIHNYIDIANGILRKGSVSAQEGERLIIPMNMRDGSLICIGKGNTDWNFSAPHGAGRLMSRSKAREAISLDEFRDSMSDVYTTSVCESTIDEAPQAYKPMEAIVEAIRPTATIERIIRPIYNFKAKE